MEVMSSKKDQAKKSHMMDILMDWKKNFHLISLVGLLIHINSCW